MGQLSLAWKAIHIGLPMLVTVGNALGKEDHLTSSSCHPKFLVKEFSYFLMPCHQHGLGVNLLVQR